MLTLRRRSPCVRRPTAMSVPSSSRLSERHKGKAAPFLRTSTRARSVCLHDEVRWPLMQVEHANFLPGEASIVSSGARHYSRHRQDLPSMMTILPSGTWPLHLTVFWAALPFSTLLPYSVVLLEGMR